MMPAERGGTGDNVCVYMYSKAEQALAVLKFYSLIFSTLHWRKLALLFIVYT